MGDISNTTGYPSWALFVTVAGERGRIIGRTLEQRSRHDIRMQDGRIYQGLTADQFVVELDN